MLNDFKTEVIRRSEQDIVEVQDIAEDDSLTLDSDEEGIAGSFDREGDLSEAVITKIGSLLLKLESI